MDGYYVFIKKIRLFSSARVPLRVEAHPGPSDSTVSEGKNASWEKFPCACTRVFVIVANADCHKCQEAHLPIATQRNTLARLSHGDVATHDAR